MSASPAPSPTIPSGATRAGAIHPESLGSSLNGWKQLSGSPQPKGVGTPGLVYDPLDRYTVLFGGGGPAGSGDNATWTFVNGTWSNISGTISTAPSPRENAPMAYDAADREIILWGGYTSYHAGVAGAYLTHDTWGFSGGTWRNLTAGLTTSPAARMYPVMVYDTALEGVLLWGGESLGGGQVYNDTWLFSHGQWQDLTSTISGAPPPRGSSAAAYDPQLGGVLVFGGYDSARGIYYNDTWAFVGGQWSRLTPGGAPPAVRGAVMSWTDRGYPVMVGGIDASYVAYDQTWALLGGNWTDLTSLWTAAPPSVWFGGITNDSIDGVEIYFGGCLALGCSPASNQTWVFNHDLPFRASLATSRAEVGASLTFTTTASGGSTTYTGFVYSGLPPGCVTTNASSFQCVPSGSGTFLVGVTVTDSEGNSVSSAQVSVLVLPSPQVAVASNASVLDLGMSVNWTVGITGGTSPFAVGYLGLPAGCSSQNVTSLACTPRQTGSFSIVAWARDALGSNVSSTAVALAIHTGLFLSFAPQRIGGAAPLAESFTATVLGGTAPFTLTWAFGDGDVGGGGTVTHTYPNPGTFVVTATVQDGLLQTYDTAGIVYVTLPMTSTLSVAPGGAEVGRSVQLSVTATGGSGPYAYLWTGLPNGCSSSNVSVLSCVPTAAGTFNPTVVVTDTWGSSTTAGASLPVAAALSASFTDVARPLPECNGPATYQFSPQVVGGIGPFSFAWAWGDQSQGTSGAGPVDHTYSLSRTYEVELTVNDSLGAVATAFGNVSWAPPACAPPPASGGSSLLLEYALVAGVAVAVVVVLAVLVRRPRSN